MSFAIAFPVPETRTYMVNTILDFEPRLPNNGRRCMDSIVAHDRPDVLQIFIERGTFGPFLTDSQQPDLMYRNWLYFLSHAVIRDRLILFQSLLELFPNELYRDELVLSLLLYTTTQIDPNEGDVRAQMAKALINRFEPLCDNGLSFLTYDKLETGISKAPA